MRLSTIRIFFLLTTVFFLLSPGLFSQYYSIGTDPASVKWKIIKTPHFKVIYPENFGEYSQYLANGFEYIYDPVSRTLGSHPLRTPVIIHNRSTVSNGLTPYAPRRIEFYTTPPQDIYAQDWIDGLMIHEFRHSCQYGAVDRGFTHVLSFIFGQQAIPAMVGLFVPFWFIEGDATVMETATSHSGRGRVPSFEMHLKAQFLRKKIYSYDKAVNGSFRDMIPDRYELGYQLVGMTRVQYGDTVWGNTLKTVGRYPFMTVPFAASLKQQTGFGKRKLYRSLALKLQEKWKMEDEKWRTEPRGGRMEGRESGIVVNPLKRKCYTSYKLPVPLNDSLLLAERTSLDDLTRFVLLDKKRKEKKVLTCGAGYQGESLSAGDSILYWSEQTQDPRWELRDYRVIKTFDIRTGKKSQLTHRSRLFSPSVSPDGKQIAAVEVPQENHYALVILDAGTGTAIKKLSLPGNLLFIHPSWSADGKTIVSAVLGKNGNSLVLIDPSTGRSRYLLPFSNYEIKRPVFYRNSIIFTASFMGTDNLFAVGPDAEKLFLLTNSRFGVTDPAIDHSTGELVYADYTEEGFDIISQTTDTTAWKPFTMPAVNPFPLAETLAGQEHFVFHSDSVPKKQYPEKPYHKGLNLFNLHSWAPLYVDVSNTKVHPGVMLLSQNLLSSSTIMAGYSYNLNEEAGKYSLSWSYEGLYPAFDLAVDYGLRRTVYTLNDSRELHVKWNELNLGAAVRLPLKWTHNIWYRSVQPLFGASWKNIDHDLYASGGRVIDRNFITLNYSFFTYNQEKMSFRDIYPHWGQVAEINFRNSPFNHLPSAVFAAEGVLFFPGFMKHQGLRVYSGYQERHEVSYRFTDYISYPRGYKDIYQEKVLSLSLNYALPLYYPDWSIGPVIYIKRFKTTLFYDHAWFFDSQGSSISSTGLDLTADFHLFGHFIPVEAGLRSIYKPDAQRVEFRFLFNINLNGL
jgi:hypothetical protein